MNEVRATFRVTPDSGVIILPLTQAPGMTGVELEKWKFESVDTGLACIEIEIMEGAIKYDIGNLPSNTIQLHFDGVSTANMASDASTRETFRLMCNSSKDALKLKVKNGITKLPISFTAIQLWLRFFI